MPNELPLDPQWQHLIEKRSDEDRRKAAAKKKADADAGEQEGLAYTGPDRRKQPRRKNDAS